MADKTGIAWADATINPCYGCSPASPGCANCYAAKMAARMAGHPNPKVSRLYEGLTDEAGKFSGRINLRPENMLQALRWRKPRRIFIGSMTDIFHPSVPDNFLDEIFGGMLACEYLDNQRRHQFILLTKRPERMRAYLSQEPPTSMIRRWAKANDYVIHLDNPDVLLSEAVYGHCSGKWDERGRQVGEHKDWGYANGLFPLPNTILMTTIEDQPRADERMPIIAELGGKGWRTGVSVEPMLGPINLGPYFTVCPHCGWWEIYKPRWGEAYCQDCGKEFDAPAKGLSWVIAGGETGPCARPMHPDWLRGLRDQCKGAGVPFFFKQWGEYAPCPAGKCTEVDPACKSLNEDFGSAVCRVGKHAAGRLLDGVEWNEFPEARP